MVAKECPTVIGNMKHVVVNFSVNKCAVLHCTICTGSSVVEKIAGFTHAANVLEEEKWHLFINPFPDISGMKLSSCDVTSCNDLWRYVLLQQKWWDRGRLVGAP